MISKFLRLSCLAVFGLSALGVHAEPAMIAKARSFLGTEEAINAVKSIHYFGSMITPDPTDPKKMTFVSVEICLQNPYQQRLTASSDRSVEITGLDSYDAWHKVQDPKDATRWRMQLIGRDQIRRLRANTWENLAFFRGIEHEGGKVVDQGSVTVDGVTCRKLAYVHSDDIVFYRYFDESTGRLVLTQTESGASMREQGEIRVNGVRFPKAIVTTTKGRDGKDVSVTLTFDKVMVNESFPSSLFAIPSLAPR